MGGVARRTTQINVERERAEHILLLDAGDSCISGLEQTPVVRAELVIKAMNRLGYQAMALGMGEFSLNLPTLQRLMRRARFALLAANLVDAEGRPVAKLYLIREIGGHRLAVIGVTTPDILCLRGMKPGELRVLDSTRRPAATSGTSSSRRM